MNILDENILKDQRELLQNWRIRIHQIGYDVGRKGMADEEIIPLLLELRRPTFFTLDFDFYRRDFCHGRYCLVCMDVGQDEAADFVRRLLRHQEFNTQTKRLGKIIHLSSTRLAVRQVHAEKENFFIWGR